MSEPSSDSVEEGCFIIVMVALVFISLFYFSYDTPRQTAVGKVRIQNNPFERHIFTILEKKNGWVKFSDENGVIHSSTELWLYWNCHKK